MRHIPILLAALLIALAAPPARAQNLQKGWWVIIASYPAEPASRQRADAMRTNAAAAKCGAKPFNDLSMKFEGFTRGLNVFVVGAYATRDAAERQARTLKPCFPDAYTKFGRYLGE